jgi:hypothetical protein
MPEGSFEKDFGYLMPFLDKIAAAGGSISDPALRQEFAGLVSGQKERWIRIRELLSGAATVSSEKNEKTVQANSSANQNASPTATASEQPARENFQFTVGSLRPTSR